MTQDEIIELARQAGVRDSLEYDHMECDAKSLEAFAKLVAEKERDACAKLCDDINAEYEAKDVFSSYAEAIRERGQA
jgi:sugar phosphate isomerase/epimerase